MIVQFSADEPRIVERKIRIVERKLESKIMKVLVFDITHERINTVEIYDLADFSGRKGIDTI